MTEEPVEIERRLAPVETIYESNFRNVAATLRNIADAVDEGKYGNVSTCAVALLAQRLEVFGCGPDSDGASTGIVLHAAFNKIMNALVAHGD